MGIVLSVVIIALAIYFIVNRTPATKSSGGGVSNSSTVFSPFGEPGKFSFETREMNGITYVWKDGKWDRTSK